MKTIEVGQTVYVSESTMFRDTAPNLEEYEVSKVNGSSFYAHKKGTQLTRRFNRKTMKSDNGMGFNFKAYETAQEYWDMIASKEEKEELRTDIQKVLNGSLHEVDTATLRKVKALLNA